MPDQGSPPDDGLIDLRAAVAFNAAYREAWRSYMMGGAASVADRLDALTRGMDHESTALCEAQVELVPLFFPDRFLGQLYCEPRLFRSVLPRETRRSLERLGYFDGRDARLDEMQAALDLPERPLPELLAHSGLRFLAKPHRDRIRGRTVIDGGAYIGDTAKLFLDVYQAGRVWAIEPEPDTFATLEAITARWGTGDALCPVQAATGRQSGTGQIWGSGVGASQLRKVGAGADTVHQVATVAIDDMVRAEGIDDIALIKLDVEGAEYDTILGAAETLRTQRPVLVISIYHTAKDFFEIKPYLESLDLGYQFAVRKISADLVKELVLIAVPEMAP